MLKRLNLLFILLIVIPVSCFGQETDPGPGYQMIMMNNPALSGSHILTFTLVTIIIFILFIAHMIHISLNCMVVQVSICQMIIWEGL